MKVGIAGIGLIGGSLARAYKSREENMVFGHDIDRSIMDFARMAGILDGALTKENIGECDCIIIALYPKATIDFVRDMAPYISKDTIVIDCCGTKREVCKTGFEIGAKYGFTFVGGHPMAGRQFSGFKHSRADLYKGASMIIIPEHVDDMRELERIKKCLEPAEFGKITVTTPEKHDEMIAFTSQMAHLVSNAYVKSETAKTHKGFSAGSFRDMTRVAYLNEEMWTELFMENKDNLIKELDGFINEVMKYREALAENDSEKLKELLAEGRECKEEVDRK